MAINEMVRAPYNFVPFSDKILTPYPDGSALPPHDAILPDRLTGEVRVTLTAETPVFVSDGQEHFHRTPAGEFAIPGSSFKGLLRENMQVLGFGLLRPGEDLEDYRIYFRHVFRQGKSKPATVSRNAQEYYKNALKIGSVGGNGGGKKACIPQNVESGWIICPKKDVYVIYPTWEPFFRVSRSHPDVQCFGSGDAQTVPVAYRAGDGRVEKIVPASQAEDGMRRGTLLYTGHPVGSKPNHLYLFPEPNRNARPLDVPEEDRLSYAEDFENRKNTLPNKAFWELPKPGKEKPVFYAKVGEHRYFGMSRYLRIGYPCSMAEGLPRHHLDLLAGKNVPLDYPHAIFGFAGKDSAYRSRVSVGDLAAAPGTKEGAPVKMVLGNPKPSYYPGYVRDGKDYTKKGFQLRGYKQYWLKETQKTDVPTGKERVGTTLRPLPAGTVFRGTVRFQNLTPEELGLLLWCIRLEPGCRHTLGMGKPYGYGRMEPAIGALRLLDYKKLYGPDLAADPWTDETAKVDEYISRYDRRAAEGFEAEERPRAVSEMDGIKDFFFMKRAFLPEDETSYMGLKEYQGTRISLPTVGDFRKREKLMADGDSPASDDSLAALANMFNRRY